MEYGQESDNGVKPVKYLNDYSKLPIDAPVGYPHIIDLDCLDHDFHDSQDITIPDLVVTILFKFMPGALTAFLDLTRPKFHYIQAGHGIRLDFCIKRDDRTVTIGFLNEKELGGWDAQHKFPIDKKPTESWTPIWFRVGDDYEVTDKGGILEGAASTAYSTFMHEPWQASTPGQEVVELVCGLSHGRTF